MTEAWLPLVALIAGAFGLLGYFVWAIRSSSLSKRPVLLGISLLSALLLLYPALVWNEFIEERFLRLERPELAIFAELSVLFICHRLLRLSHHQHRIRRTMTELLLGGAALTASLAVIGAEWGRPLDRLAVIVAVDRSRSIDLVENAESRILSELQVAELGMRDDDRIATLAFGAEAVVEDPLRPKTQDPAPQRANISRDGTDLAAAIERALAEVPSDAAARIVLLTDGVATKGDTLRAAAAAVAAGVPLDSVPLDQARMPDVRVVAVRMPSRASEGEPLEMRIVTSSTRDTRVKVRVYRDGQLLREGEAAIAQGEDVLRLGELAPEAGLHRYDVELSAVDPTADKAPQDNRGSAFVRVQGEATALVMARDPALARPLADALQTAAFRVQVVGPTAVPADIAGFAAFDVVVLSDIAAANLAPSQIDALAAYVRDLGGGLLLMGGENSFGPGGYGKTPIELVSPVSFDLKQDRRRASLAEVIAIDFSGSMSAPVGGQTKLELANEAAVRSAALLGSGDRLGVMHVDTTVHWTLPLAPVEDRDKLARTVRAVGPGGGGIYIDLSLQNAYEALQKERVNLKHLLLFSDGSDAEERTNAFALVGGAKAQGITTSVVALGQGPDVPALEHMSKIGGGRFYLIEDASRLPAVFAQETILASRSAINEVTFVPALSESSPALRGVDLSAAPPLTGYVVTIPKGRAQIHLRGPENDPILATWSVGLGRSAAFTSDFKDRWGVAWTGWPSAHRLFGQVARDIMRPADDPRVRLQAETLGGKLEVRATVVDDEGHAESFRRFKARVVGPDGKPRELSLGATGAGAYAGTLDVARPGAYIVSIVDEQSGKAVATTGAALSPGEELRPTGTNRALLRQLATVTGGSMRDTLAGIFNERAQRRFAYRSLTPSLLVIAALLLLFSVAARRLALPDRLLGFPERVHQSLVAYRAAFRETAQHRKPKSHSTLSALKQAKQRAHSPIMPPEETGPRSVPRFASPTRPETPAQPPREAQAVATLKRPGPPGQSAAEILLARRRIRKP